MKKTAHIVLALAFTLLSGCAWAKYRGYEGSQQNWPRSPGTFVDREHAIPVYYGPPSRSYAVIGFIDATTAPIRRSGVVSFAARRAKENGADAIIVLEEGSEYAGSYAFGSATTNSTYTGYSSSQAKLKGRAQYVGGGVTTLSGNIDRSGVYQGFGSSSTVASSSAIALYKGRAQVIAIKWQ